MDPKLREMGGSASRRYKVGVLRLTFESVTVWAHNPQEAASAMLSGEGAPAESWGPLDAAVAAAEMGTPEAQEMHLEAKSWLQAPGVSSEARPPNPEVPDRPKV